MNPSAEKRYPEHLEVLDETIDPNLSLAVMSRLVGENKRVLDIGCASGYFARLLKRHGCEVVGIDVNEAALAAARAHCVQTVHADVEAVPLASLIPNLRFDVVVCGDVLEHLMNPARLLEQVRTILTDDGYLVASFPNVAHGAVRLALLKGQFDYQDEGLLDDTHLRFFTLKTMDEMLLGCGYRVDELERVTMGIFDDERVLPFVDRASFDSNLVEQLRSDPEATTLQFVVKAFVLSEPARHNALFRRFLAANTELAKLKALLAAREAELASLSQRTAQVAERLRELELESRTDQEFKIEHARLEERVLSLTQRLEEFSRLSEERIAALEATYVAQLHAEAAKTRAQADQIAAYIASGRGNTS